MRSYVRFSKSFIFHNNWTTVEVPRRKIKIRKYQSKNRTKKKKMVCLNSLWLKKTENKIKSVLRGYNFSLMITMTKRTCRAPAVELLFYCMLFIAFLLSCLKSFPANFCAQHSYFLLENTKLASTRIKGQKLLLLE